MLFRAYIWSINPGITSIDNAVATGSSFAEKQSTSSFKLTTLRLAGSEAEI